MEKVYACLTGNWVCLNDDAGCVVGNLRQPPYIWWEENAEIYSPTEKGTRRENSLYGLDHLELHYKGKDYRIHPIFIQIVTE